MFYTTETASYYRLWLCVSTCVLVVCIYEHTAISDWSATPSPFPNPSPIFRFLPPLSLPAFSLFPLQSLPSFLLRSSESIELTNFLFHCPCSIPLRIAKTYTDMTETSHHKSICLETLSLLQVKKDGLFNHRTPFQKSV